MKIKTETAQFVSQTHIAYGWSEKIGKYAFAAVYNEFAAIDAKCLGVEADIGIPTNIPDPENAAVGAVCGSSRESPRGRDTSRTVKTTAGHIAHGIEKALRKTCGKQGIELTNLHITRNPLLLVPSVTIMGIGQAAAEKGSRKIGQTGEEIRLYGQRQESDRAGYDIVLTKWAGMEGMLRIAGERENELIHRFAPVFMRQIYSHEKELFAGKELEIARSAGVSIIRQITEGGILASLWELSKETGMGLNLDIRRISVLQETIEVCEYYRLNPYQLTSAGSFLMLTEDGGKLSDVMREHRIPASVIGRLISGNDKMIHNGADVRCLDRPAPDEIYKLFL